MRRSVRRLTSVFAVLASLAAAHAAYGDTAIQEAAYVEQKDLISALESRDVDRIRDDLNSIKTMQYKGAILPFLLDLWNLRRDKYPDLPWDVVSADIVRGDVANVLLQAWGNELISFNTREMHDYVFALVRSPDVDVVSEAIWTLSILDLDKDVPRIVEAAQTGRTQIFNAAVISLASICNHAASIALDSLESGQLSSENRAFLAETRRNYADFNKRAKRCGDSEEK